MEDTSKVEEVIKLIKSKFSLENEMFVTKNALTECKNEEGKHLNLSKLLEVGNLGTKQSLVDFCRDVSGVVNNINWETGLLENGFIPSCGYCS